MLRTGSIEPEVEMVQDNTMRMLSSQVSPSSRGALALRGLLLLTVTLLAGCEPRGETKTLDQVLAIAEERYAAVKLVEVPADVRPVLSELITSLDKLSKATDAKLIATEAESQARLLATLVTKAGYTSRPSIGELSAQYRKLAADLNAAAGTENEQVVSTARLLVARTYSLIASELETVRFAV